MKFIKYICVALSLVLFLTSCNEVDLYPETSAANSENLNNSTPSPERPEPRSHIQIEPVKLLTQPVEPLENSTLPRVDIVLDDDYLLSKDDYTTAEISISGADEFDIDSKVAGVKLRGNSTVEPWKKPLRIKFDEKTSVFGRPAEKSWTLLANFYDKNLLHNYIAYDLYDYLTPDGTFSSLVVLVDVYVNGGYQGVYTLCDQIETGSGRVDISSKASDNPEMTDFLIEHDYRASLLNGTDGDEGEGWFWMHNVNESFVVKSPDFEDYDMEKQTAYIKAYLDDTYDAILEKDWAKIQEYIDVYSFIIGYMVAEMVKSQDIAQSSVYMTKKANGKLTFGPLWDCDLSMGCGDTGLPDEELFAEKSFLFSALMKVPEFRNAYVNKYNEVHDDALSHMITRINTVYNEHKSVLANDYDVWGSNYFWCNDEIKALVGYESQIEYMKTWLEKRMQFLSETYAKSIAE